jgi:hypothetical protein
MSSDELGGIKDVHIDKIQDATVRDIYTRRFGGCRKRERTGAIKSKRGQQGIGGNVRIVLDV